VTRRQSYCVALRGYIRKCRARFGVHVLRCNFHTGKATACNASIYRLINPRSHNACGAPLRHRVKPCLCVPHAPRVSTTRVVSSVQTLPTWSHPQRTSRCAGVVLFGLRDGWVLMPHAVWSLPRHVYHSDGTCPAEVIISESRMDANETEITLTTQH